MPARSKGSFIDFSVPLEVLHIVLCPEFLHSLLGERSQRVLPDHLAEVGASKTYIGLYMNITSLMMVVLAIPLSLHADRFGRKRLFMWAYATAMVSYAGSFLLPANLPALAALRVAGSLLICLAFTVQTSEVFGLLPRDRRFSGMAFYGISGLAANPIGTFAGEIINGALGARVAVRRGVHVYYRGTRSSDSPPLQRAGRRR